MNFLTNLAPLSLTALASCVGLAACSPPAESGANTEQVAASAVETRKAAESGNRVAQYNLAQMYMAGEVLPQDSATAAEWYRKAAEQGYAPAQYGLALSYAGGDGVEQDWAEARTWYREAADQGDSSAQHNLGNIYAQGRGIAQDYSEAAKWYQKAAVQGHPSAQTNLAILYAQGDGVQQDPVQAHKWFNIALQSTNDDRIRQHISRLTAELAARMTPQQVTEAEELASNWKADSPNPAVLR